MKKTKKYMAIAAILASLSATSACARDDRLENIEEYYLLRESDGEIDVLKQDSSNINRFEIRNAYQWKMEWTTWLIREYNASFYGQWSERIMMPWGGYAISPVQLLPYAEVIKKDTYYEEDIKNPDQDILQDYIESYYFPREITWDIDGEKTYTYGLYEIKDKTTGDVRYVAGYPILTDETNPTILYDFVNATFEYTSLSEIASKVESELDTEEWILLEQARTIIDDKTNNKAYSLTTSEP